MKFDVIGIGGAAWDFTGVAKKHPEEGEKVEISYLTQQGGGQTGTAIVTASRLGGKGAIIGSAGDDEYGDKIRKSFTDEGVDISHLYKDTGATSHVAFCMANEKTGERVIYYNRGSKKILEPQDIDEEFIKSSKCLILDTHHIKASVYAAKIAEKSGIPVVTDIEKYTPYNDEVFNIKAYHILPKRYLLEYTGEKECRKAVFHWREKFPHNILIVTDGAEGSTAYFGKECILQKAYEISPVIDTTGAGDVFHGTFALGLTIGYDLPTNLKFASLTSALKCRKHGGRAGIPTKEEIKKYWNFKEKDYEKNFLH